MVGAFDQVKSGIIELIAGNRQNITYYTGSYLWLLYLRMIRTEM